MAAIKRFDGMPLFAAVSTDEKFLKIGYCKRKIALIIINFIEKRLIIEEGKCQKPNVSLSQVNYYLHVRFCATYLTTQNYRVYEQFLRRKWEPCISLCI